jgi:ribokinase
VDLVCVGDVMLDVRAEAGALAPGGDVHGRVLVQPGGTSANAAVWAAWSGATVEVLGAVGTDTAGDLLTRSLRTRGVGIEGLRSVDATTGTMLVLHESGERSMVADRGANALLTPDDLPDAIEAAAVLVSGYLLLQPPTTSAAVAALDRARAGLVAVEAASWPLVERFGVEAFLRMSERADVVFANELEARTLTGCDPVDACRELGERYRVAAVKRGAEGACLSIDGRLIEARGDAVAEVDPTGAGDAFDGVLLAGLGRGREPETALHDACHAGALVAGSPSAWPEVSPT